MTQEEMKKLTESITKKLGKENSGIILDDLGMLLTDNAKMNETINLQNKSIESEKAKNEKLLATNSSLLQQVGVSSESIFKSKEKKEEDEKPKITIQNFSIKDCFDSKGNFIK